VSRFSCKFVNAPWLRHCVPDTSIGSYDRTVRIFGRAGLPGAGHSREVYHTRRMQRVFSVKYSMDAKYVLSGSDDTNVRLWKARAAESAGVQLPREKQRFGHLSEIRRIAKHKHVPKVILKTREKKRVMRASQVRKETNRRKHSAEGVVPHKAARKKKIVTVLE
jgi:WD repeat and SOF domain-containing protein 1